MVKFRQVGFNGQVHFEGQVRLVRLGWLGKVGLCQVAYVGLCQVGVFFLKVSVRTDIVLSYSQVADCFVFIFIITSPVALYHCLREKSLIMPEGGGKVLLVSVSPSLVSLPLPPSLQPQPMSMVVDYGSPHSLPVSSRCLPYKLFKPLSLSQNSR